MKVMHVEWYDSQTSEGWQPIEELKAQVGITHTVGILLRESQDFLLIAHSYDYETDSSNGVITIPKSAVKTKRLVATIKAKPSTR